jgi:hypothetical protein
MIIHQHGRSPDCSSGYIIQIYTKKKLTKKQAVKECYEIKKSNTEFIFLYNLLEAEEKRFCNKSIVLIITKEQGE